MIVRQKNRPNIEQIDMAVMANININPAIK
jgi:hypothetical protein